MNTSNDIGQEEMEQIERYLSDNMSADNRAQFEQQLQQNEGLQANVKALDSVINGIKDAGRYEQMERWHQPTEQTLHQSPVFSIPYFRVWMAAAVLLLCCVSIWLVFFPNSQQEKLFAKYYKPDFGLVTAMGTTDEYAFNAAMIDYKSGNYNVAIQTWQSMLAQRPNSDTLHYFIGSAYMALKNYEQASASLQKVIAIPQSPFVRDAYWYLGLATLQMGNTTQAAAFISKSDHVRKETLLRELSR